MKISRFPLLICALLVAGAATAQDAEEPITGDVVIATVNGTPYSLDLFRLFYLERLQQSQGENSAAFQEQAFNEFMSLVVASQEAAKRQLEQDPEVAVAVELQRMKILSNAALASMGNELEPTEEELKKAYDEVKENASRTEYKARHILVKEEDEAKKLIEELEGGADFGDLARKHSLGPTGKNGGELDWFDANQMVAPFSEAVAAMEVGSIHEDTRSDPVRMACHRATGLPQGGTAKLRGGEAAARRAAQASGDRREADRDARRRHGRAQRGCREILAEGRRGRAEGRVGRARSRSNAVVRVGRRTRRGRTVPKRPDQVGPQCPREITPPPRDRSRIRQSIASGNASHGRTETLRRLDDSPGR
jgi:peptidyl-prolyl cis-trans isomerase C